jgi:hypothetical protein
MCPNSTRPAEIPAVRLRQPLPAAARLPARQWLPLAVTAGLAVAVTAASAEPWLLEARAIAVVADDLASATGIAQWTAADLRQVAGLARPRLADGRAGGALGVEEAVFSVGWPEPGADLDLGFNDHVDVDLQLPAGFRGGVFVEFAAGARPPSRVRLPAGSLRADDRPHRYRLDFGLVPRWRDHLAQLALVVVPAPGTRGAVAVGRLQVGDLPGNPVEPNLNLNLKPGMKIENLRKLESKHGCVWWEPAHEQEGFDPQVMPRRALRMIEETWQVAVKMLGHRDPCLGEDPKSTRRRKINHITWHGGFWMSGGDPPHFNVPAGGLRDEGWGNPVPHEFAHVVQGGQLDFLNGCHWESHANYVRFRRNWHFREFSGLDAIDFGVLLRSHYFQDHPRLIYADWRPYFYLDSDPDRLGFAAGSSGILWRNGKRDERFWDRLPQVLPAGVGRAEVAAGMARAWLTFDFPGGEHFRAVHFGGDEAGRVRRHRCMTPLLPVADRPGWWGVPLARAPMKFAWTWHELEPAGPVVEAVLQGRDLAGDTEDWRWGFVALAADGRHRASPTFPPGPGSIEVPDGFDRLVLFVAATPVDHALSYPRPSPQTAVDRHPEHRRYPYEIALRHARPRAPRWPLDQPAGQPHPNGGGFVAATAEVAATAYVGPAARVLGKARVRDEARILDQAVVRDSARVGGRAVVSGAALVGGDAEVADDARVRGFAFVGGRARLRDRARAGDFVELLEPQELAGDAWARGVAAPLGGSKVSGHAILDGDYAMGFALSDGVHFHHVPWGDWYFGEFAAKQSKPRGLLASYRFGTVAGGEAADEFGALVAAVRGNPAGAGDAPRLDNPGRHVLLDPSLTDAPAATWIIDFRPRDLEPQPLLAINDPASGGMVLGVGARGIPAARLAAGPGGPALTLTGTEALAAASVSLALRLDGSNAALFVNGRLVAEKPWPHPPQVWFRDATAAAPTTILLGRDAKGTAARADLIAFRAHLVALETHELGGPGPATAAR